MRILDWPEGERPREKLLARGADTLTDAELLAIFLRTGLPGLSAVELAANLLQRFGSLSGLLGACREDFCQSPGLGAAKYAQLQASLEMSRRFLLESARRGDAVTSAAATRRFLLSALKTELREVFCVLFLDSQHRMIVFETMFHGTIDAAAVYPREIVRRALQTGAAAVILAHNHPSGVAEPSDADRRITERIREALQLVDVRVLDHCVVGDTEVVSFAERGWI